MLNAEREYCITQYALSVQQISRQLKRGQQENIFPLSFINVISKVPVKRHDQIYY
jgi:hypothetical protein